jgi:hypothetical protein
MNVKQIVSVADLDAMVRKAIDQNRGVARPNPAQFAIDSCMAQCYDAGELELAAILWMITAERVLGRTHPVLEWLMQDVLDHRKDPTFGAAPNG